MHRLAITTDIHGNLPALEPSLATINQIGETTIHLIDSAPRKVNEYVFEYKPAQFVRAVGRHQEGGSVFGHTHKPWIQVYRCIQFINCGSVRGPTRVTRAQHLQFSNSTRPDASRHRLNASPTTPRQIPAKWRLPASPANTPPSSSPRHERRSEP